MIRRQKGWFTAQAPRINFAELDTYIPSLTVVIPKAAWAL